MTNLDSQLLGFLNGWTHHSALFDFLAIFFANYLVYFFTFVLIFYWWFGKPKEKVRKATMLAFGSFVLSRGVITEIIRHYFFRQRPHIPRPILDLSGKIHEASFPSGHASAMFALAAAFYFYDKRLGFWLYIAAIVTGIFRVVTGLHYPSDILGGAILGISVAFLVKIFGFDRPNFRVYKIAGVW